MNEQSLVVRCRNKFCLHHLQLHGCGKNRNDGHLIIEINEAGRCEGFVRLVKKGGKK